MVTRLSKVGDATSVHARAFAEFRSVSPECSLTGQHERPGWSPRRPSLRLTLQALAIFLRALGPERGGWTVELEGDSSPDTAKTTSMAAGPSEGLAVSCDGWCSQVAGLGVRRCTQHSCRRTFSVPIPTGTQQQVSLLEKDTRVPDAK
eukprot:678393-Rhodomonas_salina.3